MSEQILLIRRHWQEKKQDSHISQYTWLRQGTTSSLCECALIIIKGNIPNSVKKLTLF